jgi:hypothetical protein
MQRKVRLATLYVGTLSFYTLTIVVCSKVNMVNLVLLHTPMV